jgi:hypothetical protein
MVNVFKNPSRKEFSEASRSGAARAAIDHSTGDVYVWDGESALHNDVISSLPQNGMVDGAGTLWDYNQYLKIRRK